MDSGGARVQAPGQAQQRGTGRETILPFEAKRILSGGRFSSFDSRLDRKNAS